ncbi:MAG TPA: hypothetical protein GXX40_06225 [Firmicutes bacterium]|nr:hypothetical protein [Bacillota bacterium]
MDRWLENDFALKVISVLVALVLWLQVTNELNPVELRTYRGVTVKYTNNSSQTVLVDASPAMVSVTLRGNRRVLSSLNETTLTAEVNLSGAAPGKVTVPIRIQPPQGCEVAEISPAIATVTLEAMVSKNVSIEVRTAGTPPEDYAANPPKPQVDGVTVKGAASKVALVTKAFGVVDVSGQTVTFTRTVTLKPVDQEGKEVPGLVMDPESVDVTVPMKTLPPAKIVQVRAQVTGQPATGYTVSLVQVEPATIKVRGPSELVQNLAYVSTPPVDISQKTSDVEVQTPVSLPSWVSSAETRTVVVRIRITEDTGERSFTSIPVRLRSLPSGFRWTMIPAEVNITVSGRKDILNRLAPHSVEAYVDARGLTEGDHELPVQVVLPENVFLVKVIPGRVTLSLVPR